MVSLPASLLPKRQHFGLSIGRTSLRGVGVDQKGKVRSLAEVQLAEDMLESGVLVKKDLFVQAVKTLVKSGNFTTPYTAVCFSEVYAYTREYRVPIIPKEELSEAVSWNIKDLIPFPKEEIYFDWKLVDSTDKELKVNVVAVQKKILDPIVEALVTAGLKPLSIEPGTSAIVRLLLIKAEQCVLITEINRKGAYVTLVQAGKVIFTTVVNYTIEDTPETYLKNIVQTLTETAAFYKNKGVLKDESTSILLTGELATDEWATALSQRCTYPVEILKTLVGNPAFNKAYAAAVSQVAPPRDEQTINLLPEDLQRQYDSEQSQSFYKSLLIRTCLVVGFLAVVASASFLSVTLERQRLDARIKLLTQSTKAQGSEMQRLLLLNNHAKNIVALAPLRTTPKDKLLVLDTILPEGITITQWEYDDGKLLFTLNGLARSRDELLTFKNKLEQTDEFAKITLPLGSLEAPENVKFTLSFIAKK